MKTIALVGPYTQDVRKAMDEMAPDGFSLIDLPTPDDYSKLEEADYVIIRTIKLSGGDLAKAKKLKLIHKWGVGYEMIDLEGVSALGIPVAVCYGMNATPVAEMALLHILALYRNLIVINNLLKNNVWAKDEYSGKAYTISGKTVGLIGAGSIGRKVAAMVQAFGASVQYYDLYRLPPEKELQAGLTYVQLERLLATSDIVSLHVPLTEQTQNLIDEKALSLMKPTAILVNTSRGAIVDEQALARALRNKTIMGAGLDVFSQEPPGENCPFYGMENVVITPHTGGNTADNAVNMLRFCYDNIVAFDRGNKLSRNVIVNNHLLKNKLELED